MLSQLEMEKQLGGPCQDLYSASKRIRVLGAKEPSFSSLRWALARLRPL
jgi:hypothetical protein